MSQAEQDFLGSVIFNRAEGLEALDKGRFSLEDFREKNSRAVFSAIQELHKNQEPVTAMTVAALLPHELKALPFAWTDAAGSPSFYGKLLKDEIKRRALAETALELKRDSENPETDLEQLLDKALSRLSQIQDKGFTNSAISLREAAAQIVAELDQPPRFIPTPWPALNELIGGLRPGALYVIGARPGKGKSLIALQLASEIARSSGPVAFFSFEMKALEIATRALSAETGIPLGKIDRKTLTKEEDSFIRLAQPGLPTELYLEDSSSRQVSQLRPSIRKIKASAGALPVAVFIDYLQLVEAAGSSRYDVVTAISQGLKSLAMELDLPIVALAQLNRNAAYRAGAPGLADLKESGAIEQDADVVILLSDDEQGRLVMSVQKNRQGALGSLTGELHPSTMTLKTLVRDGVNLA